MASRMKMNFSFRKKAIAAKLAHINDSIIRDLMKLPHNRKCVNCNVLAPQYVCTTFSTFVCLTCSGIHREFTHRVKSVSMATFTPEEVAALQAGGNQHAKKVYLGRWNSEQGSLPDGSDVHKLREFIKHTYIQKRYADNPEKCCESPRFQKSDDGPLNRSSNSYEEISSGCGEDSLRNSISSRNCISNEAANDKIPHEKQQVKSTTDGLPTIKDAQIEQKLSKYLEELNLISDQLREAIQPFESSDSPNIYNNDASPLQEAVVSSGSSSDTNVRRENMKDTVRGVTEPKSELEPHIYGSNTTPHSASSIAETSFSKKFQSVVLKMMEHKKGLGSQPGAEPSTPDAAKTLQTSKSIGEQTMTPDNWAAFDSLVQGKMGPSLNSSNLESYSPIPTNQGMNNSNHLNVYSHSPVPTNLGTSDPSNTQPSSTSGSAPDLRHDMFHGAPYPASLAASTNRKKELTNSEALFASTFSTFSWSQAPSSSDTGVKTPLVLEEKQRSPKPLTSRNPFDVSSEPTNYQSSMPGQEEYADRSYSTHLLHSSKAMSTSSHFFSPASSAYSMMPSAGLFHPGMALPCTYSRPPPHSPQSFRPVGHEGDENDGYWHSNSSSHHRLPARSKSFSFRGNPFA